MRVKSGGSSPPGTTASIRWSARVPHAGVPPLRIRWASVARPAGRTRSTSCSNRSASGSRPTWPFLLVDDAADAVLSLAARRAPEPTQEPRSQPPAPSGSPSRGRGRGRRSDRRGARRRSTAGSGPRDAGELRPASPCCWWVEIAGIVATLLIRPRSVARQIELQPVERPPCGRVPPLTSNASSYPYRLTGRPSSSPSASHMSRRAIIVPRNRGQTGIPDGFHLRGAAIRGTRDADRAAARVDPCATAASARR